jgi:acetyl esterase/lipase
MKVIFLFALMSLSVYSTAQEKIYLWPGAVPGETSAKKDPVIAESKNDNVLRIAEVTNPALFVYPAGASENRHAGVIVCPGGGYNILAWDKEGTEIATWLNSVGISAFVLQYRVPGKRDGALQDVQRAIRIVRAGAPKWNIDPDRIGVMGFSAGGSLSARAASRFNIKSYDPVDEKDSLTARPSFALLIYPAYLDNGPQHSLTPELEHGKDVPPVFIFQTEDDTYANSALVMMSALRLRKIPAELHMMAEGGHGYGLRKGIAAAERWPMLAEKWLNGQLTSVSQQ